MRLLAAAAALGAALLTTPLPAPGAAANNAVARPVAADFPTVAQVGKYFPRVRDRELFRPQQLFTLSRDCTSSGLARPQPERGALMDYALRRGRAREGPQVRIFRYRTPAAAAGAFRRILRSEKRCFGTHDNFDGTTSLTTRRITVPHLGAQAFGVRTRIGAVPSKGIPPSRSVSIWVRTGNQLIQTGQVTDRHRSPPPRPLIGLAGTATRTVR